MRTEIQTYTKISAFENIKIEPFDVNKRYTKPHRHHKYLELVYFTKGTGMHYMDEEGYPIEPPLHLWSKKTKYTIGPSIRFLKALSSSLKKIF